MKLLSSLALYSNDIQSSKILIESQRIANTHKFQTLISLQLLFPEVSLDSVSSKNLVQHLSTMKKIQFLTLHLKGDDEGLMILIEGILEIKTLNLVKMFYVKQGISSNKDYNARLELLKFLKDIKQWELLIQEENHTKQKALSNKKACNIF